MKDAVVFVSWRNGDLSLEQSLYQHEWEEDIEEIAERFSAYLVERGATNVSWSGPSLISH